jgi:hypothetical protein
VQAAGGSHPAAAVIHPLPVGLFRKREKLRSLDEAAAYARCHGDRDDMVRVVKLPPRRKRYDVLATGEDLRRQLEQRLDGRETESV